MSQFVLYNYFRSSTSYRVRIALHLKQIPFEYKPIHLLKDGGQQNTAEYRALNPEGGVPCLVHNGKAVAQSLAILDYLEDVNPGTPLYPKDPFAKAIVKQMCEIINCTHPLHNLKVQKYISTEYGISEEQKQQWLNKWIGECMETMEKMVQKHGGKYCFGDQVTLADVCLIPQIFSAKRFKVDISHLKKINEIYERCSQLEAFKKAHPMEQIDTEK